MSAPQNSSTEQSEWISNLSPHGVLITNQQLEIRGWNTWLALSTRRPAASVLGRRLFEVYPDLVERRLGWAYEQALAGQTVVLAQRLHRYLLSVPAAAEYASQFDQMQQSAQIAPLWQDGELVGTVTVINDVTERVAREQELQHLLVLERVARGESERAMGRLEQLLQITTALSSALTPAEIAEVTVGQGGTALGAHAGLIALLGGDGVALEIVYTQGYPQPAVEPWRYLPVEIPSPLRDAVLTREPVFVESLEELAAGYPLLAAAQADPASKSLAALPLVVHDRVTGVMGLSFAAEQRFSVEDRTFLSTLAHQGAQALERARLYEAEQRARTKAESAVQIRDQFLSVAAHEFRTPLTAMLGNAQLLQRRMVKEGLTESHQRLLHVTIDQGLRLSRMVSSILDVSRLETGNFTLDVHPLSLDQLIRQLVEELQANITRHTIVCTLPSEPVMIEGDELRLEQVFHNLLSNAIKYSPEGGEVSVRLGQQGSNVTVTIQDEGIGIPFEAMPQLFQQFFRAPNVETHRIAGVGIGLYVVKEIVARHGGDIAVDSTEGQGSTFTVNLPVILPENRASHQG